MRAIFLFFCLCLGALQARHCTGKTTDHIHTCYENLEAWGMLSSIDVSDCDPDLIRSSDAIKQYVIELCDLIEMKRFGEPVVVHFGEDEEVAGYSMTQLIETSLVSGHFANKTNTIYIDVFSCKKYDPYLVARFTQNFFKGREPVLHIILRK